MSYTITQLPVISGLLLTLSEPIYLNLIKRYVSPKPWSIFVPLLTSNDPLEFFNSALSIEKNYYNKKENQILRQDCSQRVGLTTLVGGSARTREDSRTSLLPNTNRVITVDNYRIDLDFGVPLALITWLTSSIIAFAPNRDELSDLVYPGQPIPIVLTQFCQKVRVTQTNKVWYLPTLGENYWVNRFPNLKGSLLDSDFITSPEGFSRLLEFYTYISGSAGNYVKCETVTADKKASLFPRFLAGQQVTFCSLESATLPNQTLAGQISILPVNSFPTTIKSVHFYDCFILGLQHYKDLQLSQLFLVNQENFALAVNLFSSDNVFRYILCRVDGSIINNSYMENDFFENKEEIKNNAVKAAALRKLKRAKLDSIPDAKSEIKSNFAKEFSNAKHHYEFLIAKIGRNFFNRLSRDIIDFYQTKDYSLQAIC